MPHRAEVNRMINDQDRTITADNTFSGQVTHSGTRIDPGCVSPTADITLDEEHYGKTILMTSLCRKATLPLAAAGLAGVVFTFVNMHNATADATEAWVDPTSSDTINGGTTGVGLRQASSLDAKGDSLTVKCDGSGWYTIAKIGTWNASTVG
jgi:hypothetical protein